MSSTPTPYNRQSNFVTEAQGNANITVSQIATELDAEFDALNVSVDQTQSRLAELQRDDGQLRNGIVTPEALSPGLIDQAVSDYQVYGQATPMTRWASTGTGSQTTFTISGATLTSSTNYIVTVDGVTQDPASYTVSANTITFSEAPPAGTAIVVVCLGYQRAIVTPNLGAGSITNTLLADDAVTSGKIAAGAVGTTDIADNAITTAKIADNAITTAKIALGAVVNADIANGAVTPAKLSTGGPSWDTGGNVGIGTSSPDRKTVISGANASIGIYATNGGNLSIDAPTSGLAQIDVQGSNGFRVNTNSAERLRINANGTITTNANPITNCPTTAKAWVNFNGVGTPAIRSSYNVSSITKNGAGDYTVNFTAAMSDANYSISATGTTASTNATSGLLAVINDTATPRTASLCRVNTLNNSFATTDCAQVSVAIFGN